MVKNIEDLDVILTDTELDALLLKCKKIKKIRPMYNQLMKNHENYSYIKINKNINYPYIEVSKEIEDDSLYLGPYTMDKKLDEIVNIISREYKIRTCKIMNKCIKYDLNKCVGPCREIISRKDYNIIIDKIINDLNNSNENLINILNKKMQDEISKLNFEKANDINHDISLLKSLSYKQNIINNANENKLILAWINLDNENIKIYIIKGAKLLKSEIIKIENFKLNDLIYKIKENILKDNEDIDEEVVDKYYIDFAAGHGIDFHSIYGYAEQPWYEDKNMNFEHPAPDANVMRTVKSLDMDAVAAYAAQQGVGLHMWVNWKPLYARLDEALAQFEKWGVRGMMVDFMDRDDQEMIRIQEEILAAAAEHKIFVQFHGACKPTGLNRTYPNEFAREGTRNYECFKWSKDLGADLDVSIPFTRLLAGVTDYHLGGFRAVPVDKFKIQYTNPLVTVTRSHMLGMYVVLECYLGMVCDSPMSYLGQPGFEFIQQVPTVWDETVVPDASVNEYAVVARRNGENWYVGAINNTERRSVSFKTDFLGEGQYVAEIYCDNENTESDPDLLDKKEVRIDRNSVINIEMAGSGGFAIRIMPEK